MTDPIADTGSSPDSADAAPLDTIRQWGQELGFQALGFTGIDLAQHRDYLAKWLEAGYHGEMEWMASHGQKRTHPDALVPGTCTVITARMDYLPAGKNPEAVLASSEKAYISRYALGRDYHKLVRGRLAKLAKRIEITALVQPQCLGFVQPLAKRELFANVRKGLWNKQSHCNRRKNGNNTSVATTTKKTELISALSLKNAVFTHFRLRLRAIQCSNIRHNMMISQPIKNATRI